MNKQCIHSAQSNKCKQKYNKQYNGADSLLIYPVRLCFVRHHLRSHFLGYVELWSEIVIYFASQDLDRFLRELCKKLSVLALIEGIEGRLVCQLTLPQFFIFQNLHNYLAVLFKETVLEYLGRILKSDSFLRILLHQSPNQIFRDGINTFEIKTNFFIQDFVQIFGCDSLERIEASQHFIKQEAKAIEIEAMIVALLGDHLGRDVLVAATYIEVELIAGILCSKSEITQLGITIVVYHNILWFEVPVQEAFLVKPANRKSNLDKVNILCKETHLFVLADDLCMQIAIGTVLCHQNTQQRSISQGDAASLSTVISLQMKDMSPNLLHLALSIALIARKCSVPYSRARKISAQDPSPNLPMIPKYFSTVSDFVRLLIFSSYLLTLSCRIRGYSVLYCSKSSSRSNIKSMIQFSLP